MCIHIKSIVIWFTATFFVCLEPLQGQNLFPNPDFEEHTAVSGYGGIYHGDCIGWECIAGASDYYNIGNYGYSGNISGGVPSSGTGLVGMDCLPNNLYCNGSMQRESIKGSLISPLEKCTKYTVTFDLRIDNGGSTIEDGFGSECMDFGFYFYNGVDPVACLNSCGNWGVTPQVSVSTDLIPYQEYATFSIDFVASDEFNKVAIGAFYNELTNTSDCIEPWSNQGPNGLYINLDNISLTKSENQGVIIEKNLICEGDCIELIENKQDSVYSWEWNIMGANTENNSGDSVIYCFDDEGIYNIELITISACGSDTIFFNNAITVYPKYNSMNLDSSLFICSESNFTLKNSRSELNYFWSDGKMGHSRKFTQEGIYTLNANDNYGCFSDSGKIEVNFLENALLFPNPTANSWSYKAPFSAPNKIELFDQKGKIIYSESDAEEINISGEELNLATGTYLLKVSNSNCLRTFKLVFRSQ